MLRPTELLHETISKITDQVAEELLAWQRRPLEALYPVIYLDALVVKVKDGAHVRNKAARIAVGVDVDGIEHVLRIWVQTSEGARFWAGVCAELANRGIKDVLIADRLVEGQVTASWKRALAQLALAPATPLSWSPRSSPLPPPLPFFPARASRRAWPKEGRARA